MGGIERLRQIAERLGEIADALGGDSVDDAMVAELADEAARLTEEAVGETESEATRAETEE